MCRAGCREMNAVYGHLTCVSAKLTGTGSGYRNKSNHIRLQNMNGGYSPLVIFIS